MADPQNPMPPISPPPLKLLQQITGYRTTQSIRAAVELGVPVLLERGPQSADELAQLTEVHAPLLKRVLDHLVTEEVLGRDDKGLYYNLPTTRFLLPDHAPSLHAWISSELHPLLWRAWENLVDQLKTNTPAFELAHGRPLFDWLATDAAAHKRFNDQMRADSKSMGRAVVGYMSFAEGATIVDVGGGNGTLLAALLTRNPGTKGILYDLPRAPDTFDPQFAELMAAGRASFQQGSFLDSVPAGGDAYVFSRVFHDFDDRVAEQIIQNVRKVATGHERLYVIDIVLDPANLHPLNAAQDILVMVLLGGRERTAREFTELFSLSGFQTVAVTATRSPLSLIEFSCKSVNE